MENKNRIGKKVIALIILIAVFISITILVCMEATVKVDMTVTNFIHRNISGELHTILEVITFVGGIRILPLIILAISLILVAVKKRNFAILILFNSILSTCSYAIIKNIIQRPRPSVFLFINETGYSFPSGHATNNMAFYGMLICLAYIYIKNKKLKALVIGILSLWILIMGTTRIYFNVHYPSDVIAGFILGIICILVSLIIMEKVYKRDWKKIKNDV